MMIFAMQMFFIYGVKLTGLFYYHLCKELISLIYKEQVKIQEKETDKKSMGKMGKRYEQTIHKMT
ncbi:hypothetical protein ACVXPB_18925, partial [Acinetobacter baumannii]